MRRVKIMVVTMCIMVFLIPTVSFGATKTIPNSSMMVSESVKLKTTSTNYTATWTGVAGKTMIGPAWQSHILAVPIKDKNNSWSMTNFLDITFTNAGSINGRSIDVKIHVNKLTVSAQSDDYSMDGEDPNGYMGVFNIYDSHTSIGTSNNGVKYHAKKEIDITTTVVWSDTQQTVALPFFQSIGSLDIINTYQNEGWEAISGFTGTYYIYKENNLTISGNKFQAKVNGAQKDANAYLVAGLYAPTAGGSFRAVSTVGNCETIYSLYNQYALLKNPVKTVQ